MTSALKAHPEQPAAQFMPTRAAAALLGCSVRTVLNLIVAGHLPAIRLGPGRSGYRIAPAALLDFAARFGSHDPATVATSAADDLPAFTPRPVTLVAHSSADGL
ncbi:helix-turn-helix domain-containing protein, partial [Deinococcus detaillensis]